MNTKLGYLLSYLDFDKIAQFFSKREQLQSTLVKARNKADIQPLNNIPENPIIDKPMDTSIQATIFQTQRNLGHLKDNRILKMPKYIKSR